MIIKDIQPFEGQHCETTATGTLLNQLDIHLSEPLLFGIGEGLGYIFWNMKTMDSPFIGGRIKPDLITRNLARNLNLHLEMQETSSEKKAWEGVKSMLDKEQAVGLKLDCYYLEYFSRAFHFAAHYVAMVGYDEKYAFLVDTLQQGRSVQTSLESLARARAAGGPMSSKNLYYSLKKKGPDIDLRNAILQALRNNARDFLNPPISNMGFKGIRKTSREIISWFQRSNDIHNEFTLVAMLMEKAGTGGALFRNLYRDFLKESSKITGSTAINKAHLAFVDIALLWNEVSALLGKTGETQDIVYLTEASKILIELSDREKNAMTILSEL